MYLCMDVYTHARIGFLKFGQPNCANICSVDTKSKKNNAVQTLKLCATIVIAISNV